MQKQVEDLKGEVQRLTSTVSKLEGDIKIRDESSANAAEKTQQTITRLQGEVEAARKSSGVSDQSLEQIKSLEKVHASNRRHFSLLPFF